MVFRISSLFFSFRFSLILRTMLTFSFKTGRIFSLRLPRLFMGGGTGAVVVVMGGDTEWPVAKVDTDEVVKGSAEVAGETTEGGGGRWRWKRAP